MAFVVTSPGEVLFIGGRAGVGKTSVAFELHAQLSAGRVPHCVVEGDNLDMAWPVAWKRGLRLAEANLAAMWRTYRAAGYSKLIYTNTASVRPEVINSLHAALGGDLIVHVVLLTAEDGTVATRLAQREIGSALELHVIRSQRAALELEAVAPAWARRINTDDRPVQDIARDIASILCWSPLPEDRTAD